MGDEEANVGEDGFAGTSSSARVLLLLPLETLETFRTAMSSRSSSSSSVSVAMAELVFLVLSFSRQITRKEEEGKRKEGKKRNIASENTLHCKFTQ